jgi:hypothetical protein
MCPCAHHKGMSRGNTPVSGFGGLEVACWPLVPKFAGLHPAETVGFLGRKNSQHAFPCRSFTAFKRSLNVKWKSTFKQNLSDTRGDIWWQKLERLTQIAQ